MILRVILILAVVVGLMWFFGRLGKTNPQDRIKFLKLAALYGGAGILLALILTGRLSAIFALLIAAIPWIQRIIMVRSAYNMFKTWQGPVQGSKPGQTSDVRTKFLEMTLDHDTGNIIGTVTAGSYKGRTLDELDINELADLLDTCRKKDRQSASVLETYLDRMRPDEWGAYADEHEEQEVSIGGDDMTREQALQILGLSEGATREEIIEAHRVLMQRNHPDRGGSTFLAAQINRAKDLLLS